MHKGRTSAVMLLGALVSRLATRQVLFLLGWCYNTIYSQHGMPKVYAL
jgi:hypothetical protein